MPRGGAREGAGRPPRPDGRESRLVRVALTDAEYEQLIKPMTPDQRRRAMVDRDDIFEQFVAHGIGPSELLAQSVEMLWQQIDGQRDEDSTATITIVEAVLSVALENELYQKSTGDKSAIIVFDCTELANPAVVEIVVLDHDGRTIAYRYSTDSQDQDWELGEIEDAVQEAVNWYTNSI